jgi:hypothetical protein
MDNIKTVLRDKELSSIDQTNLIWDGNQWRALVKTVMSFRVEKNSENFLKSCTTGCPLSKCHLHGLFVYDCANSPLNIHSFTFAKVSRHIIFYSGIAQDFMSIL